MTPEANLSKDYFSFKISAKSKNQTYHLNLMLISKLNLEDFDDLLNSNNIIIYQLEHRKSLCNADIIKFVCHFDFFNIYMINFGYEKYILKVTEWFNVWGIWIIFIAGFSPIPYKIFTILAEHSTDNLA